MSVTRGKYQHYLVEILRQNGNIVSIDVANGAGGPLVAQRLTPPLTVAQTITVTEDPALATTLP